MVALLINVFETNLSLWLEWRINYIIDISNLLVVFNSSFNFVIYYNFSKPFRITFLKYFCKRFKTYSEPSNSPLTVVINRFETDLLKDPRFMVLKDQRYDENDNNKSSAGNPLISKRSRFFCKKKNPAIRLKESSDLFTKPCIQLKDSITIDTNNLMNIEFKSNFESNKFEEII